MFNFLTINLYFQLTGSYYYSLLVLLLKTTAVVLFAFFPLILSVQFSESSPANTLACFLSIIIIVVVFVYRLISTSTTKEHLQHLTWTSYWTFLLAFAPFSLDDHNHRYFAGSQNCLSVLKFVHLFVCAVCLPVCNRWS